MRAKRLMIDADVAADVVVRDLFAAAAVHAAVELRWPPDAPERFLRFMNARVKRDRSTSDRGHEAGNLIMTVYYRLFGVEPGALGVPVSGQPRLSAMVRARLRSGHLREVDARDRRTHDGRLVTATTALESERPRDARVLAAAAFSECDMLLVGPHADFPMLLLDEFGLQVADPDEAVTQLASDAGKSIVPIVFSIVELYLKLGIMSSTQGVPDWLHWLAHRAPIGALAIGRAMGEPGYSATIEELYRASTTAGK